MKFRSLLVLAGLALALVPASSGASHCDVPIFLFSRTRIQTDVDDPTQPGQKIARNVPTAATSGVGCTVVRDILLGEEPDPALHPATDTEYIYPGSNRMSVRFFDHGRDPSIVDTATLTFAGTIHTLEMLPGIDVTGAEASWLDSTNIEIDPAATLVFDTAVISICLTDGTCHSKTYRTAA